MKKKMVRTSLCVMVITLVIGIALILSSVSIGQKAGDNAIHRNGGSMDTNQYERIINKTTTNYQIVGGVLSLMGGFGILLSGYAFYKEL